MSATGKVPARTTAAGLAGILMAGILAIGTPVLADNCDDYALKSAKQGQENVDRKCNFSGDGWSTSIKDHKAWCESVSPDEWLAAIAKRAQQLTTCTGG
ncbi:MAG: hypothetical protein R3D33_00965 [Hyphomicrobiaceae bacterium]